MGRDSPSRGSNRLRIGRPSRREPLRRLRVRRGPTGTAGGGRVAVRGAGGGSYRAAELRARDAALEGRLGVLEGGPPEAEGPRRGVRSEDEVREGAVVHQAVGEVGLLFRRRRAVAPRALPTRALQTAIDGVAHLAVAVADARADGVWERTRSRGCQPEDDGVTDVPTTTRLEADRHLIIRQKESPESPLAKCASLAASCN